jgi:hypothetical protein
MSFIHYTLVGHFPNGSSTPSSQPVTRGIDAAVVERLLAEYPPGVAALVTIQDGYARCQWAPAGGALSAQVFEFAYRLARQIGCLAVENGRYAMHPPEAARAQGEALERVAGRTGFAEEREQQARIQAEEFERRVNPRPAQ